MKNENTNDHRLEALFSEALGTKPTPQETKQAWQVFIGPRRTSSSHPRKNLYIGIASVAAILVLTFILWPMLYTSNTTESIKVFASLEAPKEITFSEKSNRMEVSTPAGITTSLTLNDGTTVLLGANSRLEYEKEFTNVKREVTLVGKARFSVTKDPNRPFIVRTEQIQAQVLGTVFDLKAYPQTTPDVTLYEGCIEVSLNETNTQRMQPGEQAFLNKEGKLQLGKASDTQSKWAEGEFAFDNQELMDVMVEIGSWYNISIACQHFHLLKERIYFRMSHERSIEEILEVLNDLGVAKFMMKDKQILITNK